MLEPWILGAKNIHYIIKNIHYIKNLIQPITPLYASQIGFTNASSIQEGASGKAG
jgi:hypothetical protein